MYACDERHLPEYLPVLQSVCVCVCVRARIYQKYEETYIDEDNVVAGLIRHYLEDLDVLLRGTWQ
jgi:hypothetical protein